MEGVASLLAVAVGTAFYKFRKLVRYSIEDLDGWLAEHRVDPRLPADLLQPGA